MFLKQSEYCSLLFMRQYTLRTSYNVEDIPGSLSLSFPQIRMYFFSPLFGVSVTNGSVYFCPLRFHFFLYSPIPGKLDIIKVRNEKILFVYKIQEDELTNNKKKERKKKYCLDRFSSELTDKHSILQKSID